MGTMILEIGKFFVEHFDLLSEIFDAISSGRSTKDQIRQAIRDSMTTASDTLVEAELGPRPSP